MAVVRIEDYRAFPGRTVAAHLRALAAEHVARQERMREGEARTTRELAGRILASK